MRALVIGGGKHVHAEAKAALVLFSPDIVVAVNDIGAEWPGRLDHWVSLHYRLWPALIETRKRNGLPLDFRRWTPSRLRNYREPQWLADMSPVQHAPDYEPSGLSGMYAVKIALLNGAQQIVLAGVPMDQSGHFASTDPNAHWINNSRFDNWRARFDEFASVVRSMSGRTQELFGAPTQDWLKRDREHCDEATAA